MNEMTGWKFYTVNDRPVAVVPTADGGADCVVFNFATGELTPDRAYFAYVTPGSGRDVDALTEAQFRTRLAACRADAGARIAGQVRAWAQRLGVVAGTATDVAAALGLTGTTDRDGAIAVAPLPPGYREITVTVTPRLLSVRLRPAGRLLTRAILDAELGPARELPIFPDSGDEGHLEYSVAAAAGPVTCLVGVRMRHQAAAEVTLHRADPR